MFLYRTEDLFSQRQPPWLVQSNCNAPLPDDFCGQRAEASPAVETLAARENQIECDRIYQKLFRVQEMKCNGTGRENVNWTDVINLTHWISVKSATKSSCFELNIFLWTEGENSQQE